MVLYSFGLALALAVSAPWWLWRMATSGRYRAGLRGRLGVLPASLDGTLAARGAAEGLIWLHAVSVGEVLAAERLVSELRAARPGFLVVVSATTAAGYKVAGEKLGVPVFYFPLDFAFAVRRYLRALRPSLFVTLESELWPRVLVECERARIPVAVINARVSDRSLPRYMRLRWLWRPLMAKVQVFMAQGEETAGRLRAIGVATERVQVTGNLKYEFSPISLNPVVERMTILLNGRPLVVAGSTLAGEEDALCEAWPEVLRSHPNAVLVIAPRHPERFASVLTSKALNNITGYRGDWAKDVLILDKLEEFDDGSVILLNTIGDLASVYRLASVAFLGGSLVKRGGHNPLEAARFGVPIAMGPNFENFREVVHGLQAADAIRIVDWPTLASGVSELLQGGAEQGQRGREFFEHQQGATSKTLAALLELLP